MYAVGGHDGPMVRKSVEVYNPETDRWTDRADMTTCRRNAGKNLFLFRVLWPCNFVKQTHVIENSCNSIEIVMCNLFHICSSVGHKVVQFLIKFNAIVLMLVAAVFFVLIAGTTEFFCGKTQKNSVTDYLAVICLNILS